MIYTIKDKGNRITEIIKSCKTMQQCESCSNMINNLQKTFIKHKDFNSDIIKLYLQLCLQRKLILNGEVN